MNKMVMALIILMPSICYGIDIKVSSHTSSYTVKVDEAKKQIHYVDGKSKSSYEIRASDYDFVLTQIKTFLALDQKDKCDSNQNVDIKWGGEKNTLCHQSDIDELTTLLRRIQLISKKI